MLDLGEAEERDVWAENGANQVARSVRAVRRQLSCMHHDHGWGWAIASQEQRVEAERISAGLTELARSALANGCDLLPHETLPGDPDPSTR